MVSNTDRWLRRLREFKRQREKCSAEAIEAIRGIDQEAARYREKVAQIELALRQKRVERAALSESVVTARQQFRGHTASVEALMKQARRLQIRNARVQGSLSRPR